MDAATISRRYPWTQYKDPPRPGFMTRDEDTAFAKANWPFTVRWTVPDSTPGLYGWRCESRSFKSEAEAMAAAEQPMGIARDVEALRWNWDVPHSNPERAVTIYRRKNSNMSRRKVG